MKAQTLNSQIEWKVCTHHGADDKITCLAVSPCYSHEFLAVLHVFPKVQSKQCSTIFRDGEKLWYMENSSSRTFG